MYCKHCETAEQGETYRLTTGQYGTRYNCFQIGGPVRQHAGLNFYEKHAKLQDIIIFCNACATLCDINDYVCFRDKCPLLK